MKAKVEGTESTAVLMGQIAEVIWNAIHIFFAVDTKKNGITIK